MEDTPEIVLFKKSGLSHRLDCEGTPFSINGSSSHTPNSKDEANKQSNDQPARETNPDQSSEELTSQKDATTQPVITENWVEDAACNPKNYRVSIHSSLMNAINSGELEPLVRRYSITPTHPDMIFFAPISGAQETEINRKIRERVARQVCEICPVFYDCIMWNAENTGGAGDWPHVIAGKSYK